MMIRHLIGYVIEVPDQNVDGILDGKSVIQWRLNAMVFQEEMERERQRKLEEERKRKEEEEARRQYVQSIILYLVYNYKDQCAFD